MRSKKIKILFFLLALSGLVVGGYLYFNRKQANKEEIKLVMPVLGKIQSVISTTGTVLPRNRLEVKPPVGGRIEEILVKEGDRVKAGDVLAWLSSTERAALLDAARGQSADALKYWQEVYKPIALLSLIDAEVIVATKQPGTTVATADAVVVLSDRLIVRGQVDETDIGQVKEGQMASFSLDAYPDVKISAQVEHIYYESKTVNNVTIYEVDLITKETPEFMRSGMNASIDFIIKSVDQAVLLPLEALHQEKQQAFVYIKIEDKEERKPVTVGISDDKNTQIISGIDMDDEIVVKSAQFSLPRSKGGTNPFMPQRRR